MGNKYKYVFFDIGRLKGLEIDKSDYFYISTSELRNNPSITMVSYPLDYTLPLLKKIYALCMKISSKNKVFSFLARIWYPFIFKSSINKDDYVCFIVYGYYIKPDYLRYLKKKYRNCKIIKLHRDSYEKWKQRNPDYSEEIIKELFDAQFSFDVADSRKYNMIHFDEIGTKISYIKKEEKPIHDIFFAGAAKDRLNLLIQIYDYLSKNGVDCYFYITNASSDEKVNRKGIVYSELNMPYAEMLYYEINSRVILEINQNHVDGFTSRFIDSIMYDKKLITNNNGVKENGFYNPDSIFVFNNAEEIPIEFILDNNKPNYCYQGEFSPIRLVEQIGSYLEGKGEDE